MEAIVEVLSHKPYSCNSNYFKTERGTIINFNEHELIYLYFGLLWH
jgi:hypothetical protein